jgi:hypothetical protein
LTAAELEMMNLTGDGNGIDMIKMPAAWRERVPTANFFQPGGYARNPIAGRANVVSSCSPRPMPGWMRRSDCRGEGPGGLVQVNAPKVKRCEQWSDR